VFSRLVTDGAKPLLEPLAAPLPPFDTTASFSYIADPAGGKVELIEWSDMWSGLPAEPHVEGVNHVAFGVHDMARSRELYAQLGFSELIFDYDGYFEPMAPWYGESPPSQRIVMYTSWLGGAIEPVQHTPPSPDCRGEWGHAGPMEFAVGVSNLDAAHSLLMDAGVQFHSPPEAVATDLGELRYAYMKDPDGLYVSLVETRY
jgi:catechol 2,3-dioxygenase-like lactoylglutathione lyase family enzyme